MAKSIYISVASDLVKEALAQALKPEALISISDGPNGCDLAIVDDKAHGIQRAPLIMIGEGLPPTSPATPVVAHLRFPIRIAELAQVIIRVLQRGDYATVPLGGGITLHSSPPFLGNSALNRTVELTTKEAELLELLHRCGPSGIERDSLLQSVWGYAANTETHTLETHLTRLRRKLEDAGATGLDIVSQHQRYFLKDAGIA